MSSYFDTTCPPRFVRESEPIFRRGSQHLREHMLTTQRRIMLTRKQQDLKLLQTQGVLLVSEVAYDSYHNLSREGTVLTDVVRTLMPPVGNWNDLMELAGDHVSLVSRVVYHTAGYYRAGLREYVVDHNLAELLYHTEVKGADTKDVQIPYQSMAFTLRKPVADLRVWHADSGWHAVEHIFLTLIEAQRLYVMVVGEDKTRRPNLPDDYMPDDCVIYFDLDLKQTNPIENLRDKYMADATIDPLRDMEPPIHIAKFVLNLLWYATSRDARIEVHANDPAVKKLRDKLSRERSPKKKQKLREKLRVLDQRQHVRLGWGTERIAEHTGDGKPLVRRVLVQGHRKRVPVGPGRKDRKEVWIKPYWRGPELGETVQTVHELR